MSTGTSGRVKSALPLRWLALGVAAQNGVIAAMSAKAGIEADLSLLDRESGLLAALFVRREEITEDLGERFFIDETGMKPYTVARQALSAIEAFRQIIHEEGIEPTSIREVRVLVPTSYARMIDNRNLPETRMESIVGVQYQMSQAALYPDRLLDVLHEPPTDDPGIATLMARIRVEGSTELEGLFPRIWPARVEVVSEAGTYVREVLHPKGDEKNPFTWEELASKFGWVAGPSLGQEKAGFVFAQGRKIDGADKMEPLLRLVTDGGG
jgi:2-methylcitrate dehydratase PrpD